MPDTSPSDTSLKDSVLIRTPDGKLCCVTKEYYNDPKNAVTNPDMASAARLAIARGAVLAEIHSFGTGVGGFCTLVDLQALRPSQLEVGGDGLRRRIDLNTYQKDLESELEAVKARIAKSDPK